jgi:hypothetical protein
MAKEELTDHQVASFLVELETLCRKYNIEISGCGCCGSPRLDYLRWDAEDIYGVDKKGLDYLRITCFEHEDNKDMITREDL